MLNIIINQQKSPPFPTAHSQTGNFYHNVLQCVGYSEAAPPLAALLANYHQLSGDWVIVSPVYWQATHNDAMIVAHDAHLLFTPDIAKAWFQRFQTFIAPLQRKLVYHSETLWLLSLNDTPPPKAKPVHQLLHCSLFPELEQLDTSYYWQRFITESQMFLSQEVPMEPALPINGVWVWGAGSLHLKSTLPIFCETKELLRLAKDLGHPQRINESIRAHKKGLFLFENEPSQAVLAGLSMNPLNWYWNNVSYITKPISFWERLRGLRWKLE